MSKKIKLRKTNQGQYFRLKDEETAPIWVRGEYVCKEGKYFCAKLDDCKHKKLINPTQDIYIGFTF